MDGLLVVDKPAGPTSHDVVARMRRVLGERRMGHTGTLDPRATGVLPLVVGRATRLARFLSGRDKTYQADVRLGVATETYDAEGPPVGARHDGAWPSREEIACALEAFRGVFVQRPPAFSAKKIGGRRSYAVARAGSRASTPTVPAPTTVTAHQLDLLGVDGDRVTLRIVCSAGFYVRSLANDLGERLGIGAHLTALRRTHSGDLSLDDALPLELAERDPGAARNAMIPLDRMLDGFRAIVLSETGALRAAHGRDVGPADIAEGSVMADTSFPPPIAHALLQLPPGGTPFRLMDRSGRLLGIGEPTGSAGLLHPSVVLV
jgi:tRNA pseudouridine55 synthase